MKFSKIIPYIFLIISVSIFFYLIFTDPNFTDQQNNDHYYIYCIILFFLFLLSLALFRLKDNVRINCFLIFVSISISLYFVEYSFISNFKKKIIHLIETKTFYDSRNRIEVYNDFKKKNEEVYLRILHSNERSKKTYDKGNNNIYAFSSIPNKKILTCNENGYFSHFFSDRHGFNNNDEIWDQSSIKFVLIGDSFVQGDCVSTNQNIAARLNYHSKKNALNLGLADSGPLKQYSILREYLIKNKKINYVLWFYYEENDLTELENELKDPTLVKYFNDNNFSQNLVNRSIEIDKVLKNYHPELIKQYKSLYKKRKKKKIIQFLKLYNLRNFLLKLEKKDKKIIQQESFNKFEQILSQASIELKKNNIKLVFIYLPMFERFSFPEKLSQFQSNYKKIINIIKKNNILLVDINSEIFEKIDDPFKMFPYGMHGHYNAFGYDAVAKKILEKLYE